MLEKKSGKLLLLLLILAMVLVACQPATGTGDDGGEADGEMTDEPTEEPTEEMEETEEPMEETEEPMEETEEPMEEMMDLDGVTVTFWHVYGEGDPRNEAINAAVEVFNATNEYGIIVEALDQGTYSDVEDKVNAGIQSGDLPNIVQAFTSALTNWDLVDQIVDLNQYLEDPMYGLSAEEMDAIYPSVLELGITADGERVGWPFSQSANVVVYNYTWAAELGFDAPPTSPEEFQEQVCAAAEANNADDNPDNDGTGGMVWFPSASNYLSFLHAYGGTELNADGTAYEFNSPEGLAAAKFINELRDGGCTLETESFPNPEQAQRLALVTLSSTSGLRFYLAAFDDVANEDEWGFLAFPGPDGGRGVDAFTQTIGVMRSTPEQELASWLFIKALTSAQAQALWVQASGYLPTQTSTEPLLDSYIEGNPIFASTLELAALGQAEPETFPAWNSVRRAVDDAAAQMYAATSDEELMAILAALDETAAELVEEVE